jgi:hypothetical protein
MIGAGQLWQIASAWVDGIAAGLQKNAPRMHHMIDRRVRAFLQGLARNQTGVQGGRLYCAVQNGEFSHRYTAPPMIQAASRPVGTACRPATSARMDSEMSSWIESLLDVEDMRRRCAAHA